MVEIELEKLQEELCDKQKFCTSCPMAAQIDGNPNSCLYEEIKRRLDRLNRERSGNA